MAEGKKEVCSYNYWFPVLKELGDMGVETSFLLDLKKKTEKEEVVKILQSIKANVEDKIKIRNVFGVGLLGASSEGHKEGVEILLSVGGDVNYQNDVCDCCGVNVVFIFLCFWILCFCVL